MKKILVSFCNQDKAHKGYNVLIIDPVNKNRRGVIYSNISFTGLAYDENYFYAVSQENCVYVIERVSGVIVVDQYFDELKEAHSIVVDGNDVYIVSTGTDSVFKYIFDRIQKKITCTGLFWKPADSEGNADTQHINSIFLYHNELYVSGFGPKSGERWSSARNGYVYNITQQKFAVTSIYHPHSVNVIGNRIYYCESATRSVKENERTIIQLDEGYVRGLSVHDDLLVLGTSSGRKNSKSTGVVNNPADPGEMEESCKIIVFKKNGDIFEKIDEYDLLPDYTEIYDIIVL